ncbi:arginyltransferase [uncultured Ferrimonas sp.]|uniref:arginyltransferase n=1 Tax=uncultured Ferrimonas sp. TaxID=432640 RepID=UPI002610BA85|nr:arginyltransferase [uncultured Ferrimonas sp.]
MSNLQQIRIGLSQTFPCSYIDKEQETLLLCCDPVTNAQFEHLLELGFRRSGDQIYRPHCQTCNACVPVRVPVALFSPSRSQRRIIAKNKDIDWQVSETVKPQYRPLYHRYITSRHQDGTMYPPSDQQFDQFLLSSKHPVMFVEGWLNGKLIAVAVTDLLLTSLSATYTFFDPDMSHRSLGKRAILAQIDLAKRIKREHLYLGYYIGACPKMSYKTEFRPVERFHNDQWQLQGR